MSDRDVIAGALRTTPVDGWGEMSTAHGDGHRYYIGCALCGGHVDTLTTAILDALTDAGIVLTPDADGSEHPGAHALRAAADEWDRLHAGRDFTEIEALARDHYRPGMNLTTIWLRLRADQIGGGA